MVAWSALVLPIVVASALVFVASSIIHMALQLHAPDYKKLSNEDEVRAALRRGAPAPAQYTVPHCANGKEAQSDAMKKKFAEGPLAVIYVGKTGEIQIGPFLGKWIAYTLALGVVCAYLARATLNEGAAYLSVFQVVACAAWLGYAWQSPSDSIWKHKPWSVTFRGMFDGLVYAMLTAGAFAWLWPR